MSFTYHGMDDNANNKEYSKDQQKQLNINVHND